MKNIFIVGGNGFARECYLYLKKMMQFDESICFGGFLGHGGYGSSVDYKNLQCYYKGEVSCYNFNDNDYVVIGAGMPEIRNKIFIELKQRKIKFFTICLGKIDKTVKIGCSNILIPDFTSTCNISIGDNNVFNGFVIVGHDCIIGDSNFFGPRCLVLGGVKVGNLNTFGSNSVLMPKCKIGDKNIVSPLSVIYKGCRNDSYWCGNPAVRLGPRTYSI